MSRPILNSLADRAESWGLWLESHRHFAVALVLAAYFVVSVAMTARKLIWVDEFFTLYISGAGSFQDTWEALMTGADQHPPAFYFLTRLCFLTFGMSHMSLRLPAVAGFGLMMLCLYLFVARRTSPSYGIAAMVFPLATGAAYYATEARGYGLVLGFTGAALASWQAAAEGRRRTLAVPALAMALMGAVSSHYYAILLLGPMAVAEVTRTWRSRRADWPVWMAMCTAGIPILVFSPVIAQAVTYSVNFWAKPRWIQIADYYQFLLGPLLPPLLVLAVVGVALLHFRVSPSADPKPHARLDGYPHESALLIALAVLPIGAVAGAMFITNAFHRRYVMAPLLAFAVLAVYLGFHIFRGRTAGAMLLTSVFAGGYAINLSLMEVYNRTNVFELRSAVRFLEEKAPPSLAVVSAESTPFYQLSYYAPEKISSRLIYLADPKASVRHIGQDTVDRGMLDLRKWFPLDVRPYQTFIRAHREFAVWGYVSDWSWTTYELPDGDFDLDLLARQDDRLMLHATSRVPVNPAEAAAGRKQALSGASLCRQWTNDALCGVVAATRMNAGVHNSP